MVSGTVVLGLSVPLRLERPREARIKFGIWMRRFPIWGVDLMQGVSLDKTHWASKALLTSYRRV